MQRLVETLVLAELLDRVVTLSDGSGEVRILDVAMERRHPENWVISKPHVQHQRTTALGLTRSGETLNARVSKVSGLLKADTNQTTISLIAQTGDMRPADLVGYLHDLPAEHQTVIAQQLLDAHPVDVLEEFGDDDQVAIVSGLEANCAAGALDAVQSDDAVDPVSELSEAQAQAFLSLMEPEEVKNVRRLLSYAGLTVDSLMTTNPVILGPDTMVAQILASVRCEDLPASLTTVAFATRPPEETPTGPCPRMVHIQRTLREPPQTLFGTVSDSDTETISPQVYIAAVTRLLATYNLTVLPVVDEDSHLLSAASADGLLDELLSEDWRDCDDEVTDRIIARSIDG